MDARSFREGLAGTVARTADGSDVTERLKEVPGPCGIGWRYGPLGVPDTGNGGPRSSPMLRSSTGSSPPTTASERVPWFGAPRSESGPSAPARLAQPGANPSFHVGARLWPRVRRLHRCQEVGRRLARHQWLDKGCVDGRRRSPGLQGPCTPRQDPEDWRQRYEASQRSSLHCIMVPVPQVGQAGERIPGCGQGSGQQRQPYR